MQKTITVIGILIAAASFPGVPGWAQPPAASPPAAEPVKTFPLQLSLFPPIQLRAVDTSIEGFRLGIFGMNKNLTGVDLGILTWTMEDLVGVQWSLINVVEGDAGGVQFAAVNVTGEKMTGWQNGTVNVNGNGFLGFQDGIVTVDLGEPAGGFALSAFNFADTFYGLQLGLVNYARVLQGIQIGIANIASNAAIPALPIVNFHF